MLDVRTRVIELCTTTRLQSENECPVCGGREWDGFYEDTRPGEQYYERNQIGTCVVDFGLQEYGWIDICAGCGIAVS